jgi:hypothetical protein
MGSDDDGMTKAERLLAACEMHQLARTLIAARVMRNRPAATDADVAAAIEAWLMAFEIPEGMQLASKERMRRLGVVDD